MAQKENPKNIQHMKKQAKIIYLAVKYCDQSIACQLWSETAEVVRDKRENFMQGKQLNIPGY
jgi:hypothetical protein